MTAGRDLSEYRNALGQPIGFPVPDWRPPPRPSAAVIAGRRCRLERLDPNVHVGDLHAAYSLDPQGAIWTYLAYGPFKSAKAYRRWVEANCLGDDPVFYAIVDGSGRAVGVASYLRINPRDGVIEVGHINYSPLLQKTAAATEAMYLMMRHAFESGYRRYEWKCDALNAVSRRAAARLGFTFEGVFRQATLYKGRNRDTAWYAIIDREWPVLKTAYENWLADHNFHGDGKQVQTLSAAIEAARGETAHPE